MIKITKLLNTVLISQLFISSAFGMESKQSQKIGEKINEVPLEVLAIVADYHLGNFSNSRNDFKKKYKAFLDLKLVNKRFKGSLDIHFENKKVWDKFEDHLFKLIKEKSLNIKDELFLAAEIGSKKYFQELQDNDLTLFANQYDDEIKNLIETVLDFCDKKYPKNVVEIIIQKLISNTDIKNEISQKYSDPDYYFSVNHNQILTDLILKHNDDKNFKEEILNGFNNQKKFRLVLTTLQTIFILFILDTHLKIKNSFPKFNPVLPIAATIVCAIISFNHKNTFYNNKKQFLTVTTCVTIIYSTWYFLLKDYFESDSLFIKLFQNRDPNS